MKTLKQILSLLLCLAMVLSFFPAAYAEEEGSIAPVEETPALTERGEDEEGVISAVESALEFTLQPEGGTLSHKGNCVVYWKLNCTPDSLELLMVKTENDTDTQLIPVEEIPVDAQSWEMQMPGTYCLHACAGEESVLSDEFVITEAQDWLESMEEDGQINDPEEEIDAIGLPSEESEPQDIKAGGTCGENMTWTLDDNWQMTIKGTGYMSVYSSESSVPWANYSGAIKSVVIKSGVESIGNYAFSSCTSLTSVSLPDSVSLIGSYSFSGCSSLKSISLKSVETINDSAFENCTALYSLTIPSSVKSIGSGAFEKCTELYDITIEEGLTDIGFGAFQLCSSLKTVRMPSTVSTIGAYAFNGCKKLEYLYISSLPAWCEISFKTETSNPMFYAKNLYVRNNAVSGRLTVPDGVTRIRPYAFSGYKSSGTIVLPSSLTTIEQYAFTKAEMWYVILPASLTSIGQYAFSGCACLQDVMIPPNVSEIGYYAFSECVNLKSARFQDGCIKVGSYMFSNCSCLANVRLPLSMSNVGSYAFQSCPRLTTVFYVGTADQRASISFNSGNQFLTTADWEYTWDYADQGTWGEGRIWTLSDDGLLCVCGSGEMPDYNYYAGLSPWYRIGDKARVLKIDEGVTNISVYAFEGCSSLACLVLPTSVTKIDVRALPGSITDTIYAGSEAQHYEIDIASTWNGSRPSLGTWHYNKTFEDIVPCTVIAEEGGSASAQLAVRGEQLRLTVVPDSGYVQEKVLVNGETVDAQHYYVRNVESLLVQVIFKPIRPDRTIMANGSFGKNMYWVLYDKGLLYLYGNGTTNSYVYETSVPWHQYRQEIQKVEIENGVTDVCDYAFYGCSSLTSVTIPDSVKNIGSEAFRNCPELKTAGPIGSGCNIEFGWSSGIPRSAFANSNTLQILVMPTSIKEVGYGAFLGCDALDDIFYEGSAEQKSEIGINGDNSPLTFACWHLEKTLADIVPGTLEVGEHGSASLKLCVRGEKLRLTLAPDLGYTPVLYVNGKKEELQTYTVGEEENLAIRIDFAENRPEQPVAGGSCGDQVFWSLYEDGILYIYGNGEIGDWSSSSDVPWCDYCAQIRMLELGRGVMAVGYNAFQACSELEEVFYHGTEEEKALIEVRGNNEPLTAAFWHFEKTYADIVPSSLEEVGEHGTAELKTAVRGERLRLQITAEDGYCMVLFVNGKEENLGSYIVGEETFLQIRIAFKEIRPGETFIAAGACGDHVFWAFYEDESLFIHGTGAMWNWSSSSGAPWNDLSSSIVSVRIEPGVTSVGNSAFYGCSNLMRVAIPSTLTMIDYSAFYGCAELRCVAYSGSETERDGMSIKGSNDDLLNATWYYNASIVPSEIVAKENGTAAGFVLRGEKLDTLQIYPDPGYRVDTVRVNGIVIDMETYTVGQEETLLIEVEFTLAYPERTISEGGCFGDGLNWVLYTDGMLYISGRGAMKGMDWSWDVPWDNLRSSVQEVLIDEGVTSIGSRAFSSCRSLTRVTIPESVTKIGNNAFSWCSVLESVTIPEGVTSIGDSAFANCGKLETILVKEGNPAYQVLDGILYDKAMTTVVCCPASLSGDLIVPDGVTIIGGGAFSGCSGLNKVVLPDGVTSIGGYAFYSCSTLKCVTIPDSVTNIGNSAFWNCYALMSVTIPEGVTEIGSFTFSNCRSLSSVTIPSSMSEIDAYAFSSDNALRKIVFSGSAPKINDNTFSGVKAFAFYSGVETSWTENTRQNYGGTLTWIACSGEINGYVISYNANGGSGAPNMQAAASGETLTITEEIPTRENCEFLGWAEAPDAQEADLLPGETIETDHDMELYAVWTMKQSSGTCGENLTWTLEEQGSLTISGAGAMTDWTNASAVPWFPCRSKIQTVTIQPGVKSVGSYAFSGCGSLTAVTIPTDVTRIGSFAFSNCISLKEILFKGSAPSIREDAFSGVKVTAYYPASDPSWTEEVRQNYGGNITWVPYLPGDVNGDGTVDILDLIRLRKYLAQVNVEINSVNTDLTGDGLVNADDLVRLRKYLVGDPTAVLD